MTQIQIAISCLLRAALTGKHDQLPENFSLSELVLIAKKHQCENLFYYGALNCNIPQTDPAMVSLMETMLCCYAVNENQVYESKQLFHAFETNRIEYLPLKGTVLKALYPKEDMRMMGDIDILIHEDRLPQIRSFLEEMGYSFRLESAHEVVFKKGQMKLELHKYLIPPYHKDLCQFFGDGWQLSDRTEGTYRCSMSDENTYLYLFAHFSKHFRDGGIGIRHLTDLWVWQQTHPDMDQKVIEQGLERLCLQQFHQNIDSTIEVWFAGAEATEMTDFITGRIISSGVFGQTELRRIGTATVNATNAKSARQIQNKNIISLIFPPKTLLQKDYPVLKKCGFLLPAIWVIRAFKAIFIKGSVPEHANRMKQLSASSIKKYQQSLKYVGLETEGEDKK